MCTHPCAHEQKVHCMTDGLRKKWHHLPVQLAVEGHAQRSAWVSAGWLDWWCWLGTPSPLAAASSSLRSEPRPTTQDSVVTSTLKIEAACHGQTVYLWSSNEEHGTSESQADICIGCTSLQSVKNLCSWCDAASICLRVSISSRRSAHDSFSPSFHSAMVAASEWPQSIISFTILFTCSMRCWPMLLVSEANLVNRSWSTWDTHKPHNTTRTGHNNTN